jgi:ParB family chromosome partitioning protein
MVNEPNYSSNPSKDEPKKEKVRVIPLEYIDEFPGHPFKVLDDESMQKLMNSIEEIGVQSPIVARIKEDQRYEIISGHRRVHACRRLGLKLIPAIVRDLSRDEAIIAMVDANLQREHILPSEKAAAYKMKMDAMKRRAGRPSKENVSPLGTNLRTDEIIAQEAGESRNQVQRYIRLNELVPELLEMVDRESIAFRPAVELSYLSEDEQRNLVETIDSEEATPSLSQAIRMKKLSQEGKLDMDKIFSIMTEEKPNQAETVKFKSDELSRFFPERTPPELIRQTIFKLLDAWQKSKATERTIIRRSRDDAR